MVWQVRFMIWTKIPLIWSNFGHTPYAQRYLPDIGRNGRHCMNQSFLTAGLIHNIGELVVVSRHPGTVQCTHFSVNQQPLGNTAECYRTTYKDITIRLLQV